mmetsp:Transcript_6311/g.9228  ORF Transcript_6311/g.9228 Transcript_6311/m.9228 type:complete len:89 (-) Transcript_6311:242-508(-)
MTSAASRSMTFSHVLGISPKMAFSPTLRDRDFVRETVKVHRVPDALNSRLFASCLVPSTLWPRVEAAASHTCMFACTLPKANKQLVVQ